MTRKPRAAAETSMQRVARLLGIVTYVHNAGSVEFDELAQHFDVSGEQLKKDLNTLWCSGLPGYGGGDLIEVDHFGDLVEISNVEHMGITAPLRLSVEEGVALLAGVNALAQIPGVAETATIDQVREILTTALGEGVPLPGLELELVGSGAAVRPEIADRVQQAIADSRRMKITYVSNRDETTEREIDPVRVIAAEGNSYLRAWCYRAGGERLFRLDRISDAEILDAVASDHPQLSPEFSLTPSQGDEVTLEVVSPAQWVLQDIGARQIEFTDRGVRGLVLVGNPDWFVSLLLSLGDSVIEVSDQEYSNRVHAAAQRALERYEITP